MKMVYIQDGKQLEIYMHPKRQQILHELSVQGPMTAKMLSDALGMTPSSAKHHVSRLMELQVVEVDHTELIHGITATYYRKRLVTVSFSSLAEEKRKLASDMVTKQIHDDFYKKAQSFTDGDGHFQEDQSSGVIHLSKDEADELYKRIRAFIDEKEKKEDGTEPFVFSLMAYHA